MNDVQRFVYAAGGMMVLPQLPLRLGYQNRRVDVSGLLDTGSTVNVLPYALGLQLGAVWDENSPRLRLTGNLARFDARPLIVDAYIGQFEPVEFVFAWTQSDTAPLILGQVNFFQEFNVCFFRSEYAVELRRSK